MIFTQTSPKPAKQVTQSILNTSPKPTQKASSVSGSCINPLKWLRGMDKYFFLACSKKFNHSLHIEIVVALLVVESFSLLFITSHCAEVSGSKFGRNVLLVLLYLPITTRAGF